jgi:multisubunit Na+/H+ antiporter MnhC subunit
MKIIQLALVILALVGGGVALAQRFGIWTVIAGIVIIGLGCAFVIYACCAAGGCDDDHREQHDGVRRS